MQFSATDFDNVKFEDICKECKGGQSSGQLVMVLQRVSCSSKQEGTFTTNGIIYMYISNHLQQKFVTSLFS